MASRIWSRDDIRNILLAIYAARLPPEEPGTAEGSPVADSARHYQWGRRAAVQSLMLAFGLPLQLLDQAAQHPAAMVQEGETTTGHWWLEDLDHIIAAVYRSAISASLDDPDSPSLEHYRRGFGEVIAAILQAIGSKQDLQHWFEETRADRYWIFVSDQNTPAKLIGSPPDGKAPTS